MLETPSRAENRAVARKRWLPLILLAILVAGAALRLYNVNWDEGTYHIHPDERSTTMVVDRIEWPDSLIGYFDTSHSTLNARNVGMVYFYGTFPLYLTKAVAGAGDALQEFYAQMQPDPAEYLRIHAPLTSYDRVHLVGRVLSAIFDLATIVLTYFLGRRLFDWRVGLIAAALLAFTVLNIQGSHYFAVDTFLGFFVILTLWFTLDVAEGGGARSFVNLGLAMGLTLSTKVSVFLLVAVIALAAWVRVRRRVYAGEGSGDALLRATLGLALAVVVAWGVFRVAQPYAWAGPNYDRWDAVPAPWGERLDVFRAVPEPIRAVIMPNPQWIADIVSAGAQQTGEADLPWGRQWTGRAPWLWPLENMVLWTLGVPLGVSAWLGVFLAGFLVVRAWWRRRGLDVGDRILGSGAARIEWDLVLIPLAWVVLLFLWQGAQYVKSVRYFLPIHPYLAIFAGFLLVSVWAWARQRGAALQLVAATLMSTVVIGTMLWSLAFIQIYTEPVTRVQATRWIYDNVPSAATLHYRTPEGEQGKLQLPLPSTQFYPANGEWQYTTFTPPEDMLATEVVMSDLATPGGTVEGAFEVLITTDDPADPPLTQAEIEATFREEGGRYVFDIPDADLAGGETYYFDSRARRGAPLVARGAVIANEHFDDPLPFNMFGYAAFGGGLYRSLDVAYPGSENRIDQLPLYDDDRPEKLEVLLDALDQADYVIMSSGRLWQSIPRLPMRYPMTTRYYDLLFAEELGFRKAAEFHAYPRLFGIEFDDTWAEEQFTVYDHPKVLIYEKTDAYDRERVKALLSEGIDWSSIPHGLNPRDVPEWRREQAALARAGATQVQVQQEQNDLMLTADRWALQQESGTWASIFDRNSLANRYPTFFWLLLMAGVGLAALPLTLGVFRRLPDRGYLLARPAGVLLLAWLAWMLTNLTPLRYTQGTILLALGLVAAASAVSLLVPAQRRRLRELWTKRRLVLVGELLFLAFFALFWIIRWGNPDLWHAWKGGEKPMDFAYLNAVIKSVEFPPYDPWFAGGYLNYYYFGQVMAGTLIKLIGIVPNVAYNLVLPTWFAMVATGAFSATYNLVARGEAVRRRDLVFAFAGAVLVALLGNLAQVHLILLKVGEGVMAGFESTIPGLAGLLRTVIGSAEVVFGGKALPIGLGEWYWNASRAIPGGPYESVITEFPFFTFLYADLHAHLLAMPLTFLSLSAALAVVLRRSSSQRWRGRLAALPLLLLWALAIGAMRTTNTWDVPPHLLIVLGALVIGAVTGGKRPVWLVILDILWQFALVLVLSWWLLYAPFWASYGSFYNSLAVWTGTRTPLWAYLVVHGLFLFAIVSYLAVRVAGDRRRDPLLRRLGLSVRYRGQRRRLARAARIAGARGVPVSRIVWFVPVGLALLVIFLLIPGLVAFTQPNADAAASGAHAYRGLVVLALGVPFGLMGLLLLFRPRISQRERLWTYLVLLGLAMSLGVEVIVIQGDIGRMNTVFKFYLQVWLLWGVAAAAALAWIVPRVRRWQRGQVLWTGVLVALLLVAALYPPLATAAKVQDRFDPSLGPGLDGWAYMETATYWDPVGEQWGEPGGVQYELKWDLEAIHWLLDNVVGTPVILEGHVPEYRWGARYSINTGLPTVLGWNWHQRQQRAAADQQEIWDRAADVTTIYDALGIMQIEDLLERYDVRYIVVGPLERAYYDEAGLRKFDRMVDEGSARVAFANEGVTIYEVVR